MSTVGRPGAHSACSRQLFAQFARTSNTQEGNAASARARLNGVAPPWYLLRGPASTGHRTHLWAVARSQGHPGAHVWVHVIIWTSWSLSGMHFGTHWRTSRNHQNECRQKPRPNVVDSVRKMIVLGLIVVRGPCDGVQAGNLCGVHRTNEAHSVHTAQMQSMWCTPRECDSKFHLCGEHRTDAAHMQATVSYTHLTLPPTPYV